MITLLLLVRATYMYRSVVLRAHSVRGESHIQCNVNGEVATIQSACTMRSKKSRNADNIKQAT